MATETDTRFLGALATRREAMLALRDAANTLDQAEQAYVREASEEHAEAVLEARKIHAVAEAAYAAAADAHRRADLALATETRELAAKKETTDGP